MPKIVDAEQRRAQIARACWRVIVREGIAGVTTRAVADEAGIGKGVLFHYFRDKEDLIRVAFDELVETFRHNLRAEVAPAADSVDRLRLAALSNLPINPGRADEFGVWLSMWAQTYTSESLRVHQRDLYQNWREILTSLVQDCIADGRFSDELDPQIAAIQLAGITDGLVVQLLLDRRHTNLTGLASRAVDELIGRWDVAGPRPTPPRQSDSDPLSQQDA